MPRTALTRTVLDELKLDHRAFHLARSRAGQIAACSQNGCVSIVDTERNVSERFNTDRDTKAISFSADGDKLAMVFDNRLAVRDSSGNVLGFLVGAFESAFFDDTDRLWTAGLSGERTIRVQIYKDFKLELEASIEDPFGDSTPGFPDRPGGNPIPLWLAAGQDGQTVYWLQREDQELTVDPMDDLVECGPPTVSDWADEFLIFTDENVLSRYSLWDFEVLEELELASLYGEDPGFGLSIAYVSMKQALVSFENGRIYLVNLEPMGIEREIVLRGHEPRPIRELYPGLDEDELSADVVSVFTVDDQIVSLHTQLPNEDLKQLGTLVWWSKDI